LNIDIYLFAHHGRNGAAEVTATDCPTAAADETAVAEGAPL